MLNDLHGPELPKCSPVLPWAFSGIALGFPNSKLSCFPRRTCPVEPRGKQGSSVHTRKAEWNLAKPTGAWVSPARLRGCTVLSSNVSFGGLLCCTGLSYIKLGFPGVQRASLQLPYPGFHPDLLLCDASAFLLVLQWLT